MRIDRGSDNSRSQSPVLKAKQEVSDKPNHISPDIFERQSLAGVASRIHVDASIVEPAIIAIQNMVKSRISSSLGQTHTPLVSAITSTIR